jgi:uncharacterized membrane protein
MDANVQTSSEPSTTQLVTGIFHDIQELFKQQMALFRTEVKNDARRTAQASLYLAVGGVVVLIGAVLLCQMLVYLLYTYTPLDLWACYLIIGVVITLLGGLMIYLGREKFQSFNPLPDESMAALKENLEWTTKPR